MKRPFVLAIALLALLLAVAVAVADDAVKQAGTPSTTSSTPSRSTPSAILAPEHRTFLPSDIKWVDGPPSLPKGTKMAVLYGDMAAPGLFCARAMLPAGYKVPPHFHPVDEKVTVISGEFMMGLGDQFDESKGHAVPPGGMSIMPKGMHHFAWSKVETVIQIDAMGPWGITYVNPQDDPRNAKQATK